MERDYVLITNEIETKWNSKTKKYYESLGYKYTKMGDSFLVNVHDLKQYSAEKILCKCDYCGEIFETSWGSYYQKKQKENKKDCCANPKCTGMKAQESLMLLYGVENPRQLDFVNEKIKETNIVKYGCENPFGNKDVQNKIRETNIDKYGVPYPTQNKQVTSKTKNTCMKKYGTTSYLAYYSITHLGDQSPVWKGGVEHHRVERATYEYIVWRRAVFGRDNYTCQCCGDKSAKNHPVEIHAHHILNWNDNKDCRYDVDNGITLCDKCHYKFHSQYGKLNNTKEQLEKFLNVMKKDMLN